MTTFTTDYNVQDIAMNLIMEGYATADDAIAKAEAIAAGMEVVNNLNEAAAKESDKCEIYRRERKLVSFKSTGEYTCEREYKTVIAESSTTRANSMLKLKEVEWKMMMDVTGLNEFQIMEVA